MGKRFLLRDKIRFLRYISYGCTKEQAWLQTFGYEMNEEEMRDLCCNEDFELLRAKYKDELLATGDTRDEIMLELDELNKEAERIGATCEKPTEALESIKVRQRGLEMKAKISKKMNDKAEINLNMGIAVASDDELLRAMNERAALRGSGIYKNIEDNVVEAEYEEVKSGESS